MPRTRPVAPPHVDLWEDLAMLVATLGQADRHAHAVPALVVGLDGAFLYGEGKAWLKTRVALIPAGRMHGLECGGTRTMTLFLTRPGGAEFTVPPPGAGANRLCEAALAAASGALSAAEMRARLKDVVSAGWAPTRDPRLTRVLELLRSDDAGRVGLAAIAEEVRLSDSRLMHLLREKLGVPFRQLRRWERMRRVVQKRAEGDSLTHACLAAGFADSSHFSHAFRTTFGVAASSVLGRAARVRASVQGADDPEAHR